MIIDLAIPSSHDEPLPPPAWLVGVIIATLLFVGAAVLASIPHEPRPAPYVHPVTEPVLHSGIV